MRLMIVVFGRPVSGSFNSPPKTIFAMATESAARSGAVTEPMNALSLYLRWLYTMSRCRLLTGRSTGSPVVPARVVQRTRHVGKFDEIAKVLDAGVAAALVETAHEGRPVCRREHGVLAADDHAARRVASVLGELARGGALDERSADAPCKLRSPALDVGARRPPDLERLGVVAEIDADLLENGVGVVFHQRQTL